MVFADNASVKSVRIFFWTCYATDPRLRLYSSGLMPPRDSLMCFLLYHLAYAWACKWMSLCSHKSMTGYRTCLLIRPKNPSQAAISGEQPFFNIYGFFSLYDPIWPAIMSASVGVNHRMLIFANLSKVSESFALWLVPRIQPSKQSITWYRYTR